MTTYRTNLRTHEAAKILEVSRRQAARYVERGWLTVAWRDEAGPRFNEIDVLALKNKLRSGKLNGPAVGEGKRVRARVALAGSEISTP